MTATPSVVMAQPAGAAGLRVEPWYSQEGPEVAVGPWSGRLAAADDTTIDALARDMLADWRGLPFEAMYVLSIRLHDLGRRDEAVFWFYAAQARGLLFRRAVQVPAGAGIGDPGFELAAASGAFQQVLGEPINGYAGCDVDRWVAAMVRARDASIPLPDFEAAYPQLRFVEPAARAELNAEVLAGLDGMIGALPGMREAIRAQRAANGADERYCQAP